MTGAELDSMFQRTARKIVAVEVADLRDSGPAAAARPTIVAMLDDGRKVALFTCTPDERPFSAGEFVGLTVDEGRRLQFAPRTIERS